MQYFIGVVLFDIKEYSLKLGLPTFMLLLLFSLLSQHSFQEFSESVVGPGVPIIWCPISSVGIMH